MKITSFSIKRPVTIFMAIITILMFGVVSFFKLNVDMLPSFNLPMLMVVTSYPGAGPEGHGTLCALLPPGRGSAGLQPAENAACLRGQSDVLHRYAGHHRLWPVGYRPGQTGADLCPGHGL